MKIPTGMTEDEVVKAIKSVTTSLAYKFRFPGQDIEDMKQQGYLIAWESLAKYDGKRNLKSYLWTVVHHGLYNFKRDNYERHQKPCLNCPLKAYIKQDDHCTAYENLLDCEFYDNWLRRNESKKCLVTNMGEDTPERIDEGDHIEEISKREILDLIDKEVSVSNRANWLKMRHGVSVGKAARVKVIEEIRAILEENGISVPNG